MCAVVLRAFVVLGSCWFCVAVTVAILAQGTLWAFAATQALDSLDIKLGRGDMISPDAFYSSYFDMLSGAMRPRQVRGRQG